MAQNQTTNDTSTTSAPQDDTGPDGSQNETIVHYMSELGSMSFQWSNPGASFIVSFGALLMLMYCLSILVAYLHIREYPVVFPLTCPTKGEYFIEYFILIKTSQKPFSALDTFQRGRLTLQLHGSYADSPVFDLKKPKGSEYFCTRGGINIFVYHSEDDLGDILTIKIGLTNDAPYELSYVSWRPCFALVMRPSSKAFWGVQISKKLKTAETITEEFECKTSLKDTNSIIKSVARFHNWVSMFNSPTRFGFYSNIVHTLMFFFTPVLMMCLVLVWRFVLTSEDFNNELPDFLTLWYVGMALIAICVWIIQCIFEALLRLSRPHYSCANIKFYKGLVESIESPFLLDDFLLNYDWTKRRPLIPRVTVTLPCGTRHGYAQSIFPVKPLNSMFNMWGFLNQDEQREWSHSMRCINSTALPLPFNVRWLAKEAWGCKVDVMLEAYDSNFTFEHCLFHTWLQDWPMDLISEPQQAGLVFSNIIAKDIQVLIKIENKEARARFARICLFQWHGLMCALFLHVILIEADRRNEKISGIKTFIHKNLDAFSKRSPREIQAGWKKRRDYMKQMSDQLPDDLQKVIETVHPVNENIENLIGTMVLKGRDIKKFELATYEDDENMSALPYNFVTSLLHKLFPVVEMTDQPALTEVKIPPQIERRYDDCMDFLDFKKYEKDDLLFEDSAGRRTNSSGSFLLNPRKNSNDTKILADDNDLHGINDALSCLEAGEPARYHEQKGNRKDNSRWPMTALRFRCSQSCEQNLVDDGSYLDENNCAISNDPQKKEIVQNKLNEQQKVSAAKKREEQEKIAAVLKDKQQSKGEGKTDGVSDRRPCDMAAYEEVPLGKFTNEDVKPVKDPKSYPTKYLRHKDEISGYCCSELKCDQYMQVHRKVGHSSLEILKKVLTDLLCYAIDARYRRQSRAKTWFRKKMVKSVFDLMHRKASMYDDNTFTSSDEERKRRMGFICNELMTQTLTVLKITVDVINLNRYVVRMIQNKEYETMQANMDKFYKLPPPPVEPDGTKRLKKCSFCAKVLQFQPNKSTQGCDQMKKLVKFFSRDTCSVAEKEIHYEFLGKYTVQNYCAMVMNIAKKELLIELEDPPLVLISRVIRAMTHMLLVELQPKVKDVKDMNAEELRRMGTRRQRIQARHDTSVDKRLKETEESKRKKEILQILINETAEKWKVNLKNNELTYTTRLLAECLVQERFIGFTLYSGFISKDQETLLGGSRHHLGEMEIKAYNTIMVIGRKLLAPQLKTILDSSDETDVLFSSQKLEVMYLFEAINVLQFTAREPFLGTCCHYIDDIVNVKVAEFLEFKKYMRRLKDKSIHDLPSIPAVKTKRFRTDFEAIQIVDASDNSFTSPALRWGRVAIRGEILPEEYKHEEEEEENANTKYKAMVPQIMDMRETDSESDKLGLVYDLLYSRDVIQSHCDSSTLGNSTQLRTHLAKTQARLTDQIAVGAQSMADTFDPGSGYQRDFLQADLFNVEYYCTGKMKLPFGPTFGIIICFIVVILTVFAFFYTMMLATRCSESDLAFWLFCTGCAFATHFAFLELMKAIIYLVFGLFVDGYYK